MMLKIIDRGQKRRNRFLIMDGDNTVPVGVFGNKKDAENRLKELQDETPKKKTSKFTTKRAVGGK